MPSISQTSNCQIFIGTDSVRADLIGSLQSDFTITAIANISENKRITGTGQLGFSRDGISVGFNMSGNFYRTSETEKVVGLTECRALVVIEDASWALGGSFIVTATPVTMGADSAVTMNISLAQSAVADVVIGTMIKGANTGTVTTGQQMYVAEAAGASKGVRHYTATHATLSGEYAVIGAPQVAEGGK